MSSLAALCDFDAYRFATRKDRQRERGYNQAELIARPLARRLGLELERYLWLVPARALLGWCYLAQNIGNQYVAPTPPGPA